MEPARQPLSVQVMLSDDSHAESWRRVLEHLKTSTCDDLAILWIDSHPDIGTGETAYPGFHAMVVSALTDHGDQELLQILPSTITADRARWSACMTGPTRRCRQSREWGLSVFSPDALRSTSAPLLD